jgi:hypothetical protein
MLTHCSRRRGNDGSQRRRHSLPCPLSRQCVQLPPLKAHSTKAITRLKNFYLLNLFHYLPEEYSPLQIQNLMTTQEQIS